MEFGMPTLIELNSLAENAALCQSLGLKLVEINLSLPHYQQLQPKDVITLKQAHRIAFSFHLAEDIDIAHFDDRLRQTYWQVVADTILLMAQTQCQKLTFHMSRGIYFTMPDKKIQLYDIYQQRYLHNIKAFRDFIDCNFRDSGVRLLIENTMNFHLPFIRSAVAILLQSSAFGLTWDIGHDYRSGHRDSQLIKPHRQRVEHIHLHDAIDGRDHLALGSGQIDLQQALQFAADHHSSVVVETKTISALKQSVRYLNSLI